MSHSHICPRCQKPFEHQQFGRLSQNRVVQAIVRAIHRFYGACEPCCIKFIQSREIFEDPEVGLIIEVLRLEGSKEFDL